MDLGEAEEVTERMEVVESAEVESEAAKAAAEAAAAEAAAAALRPRCCVLGVGAEASRGLEGEAEVLTEAVVADGSRISPPTA